MQKKHEALLMPVGDGNVEVGRHLGLLDLNVCWSPLWGRGGSQDRVPYWERGTTSGGSVGEVETGCVEWSCRGGERNGKGELCWHSPFVVGLEIAGGAGFEVARQFGGGFKLGHGVEFFEGGSKRIRKAPEGARLKLWILRLEIEIMHAAGKMFGNFEFAFDEGFVDEEFGGDVGQFVLAPGGDLALHGFEVALHAVNADGDGIEEGEGFGMFGENGGEVSLEGHIGANEDAIAASEGQAHRLVVRISQADGEAAAVDFGFEVKDAEHFHAVGGDGVFVVDGADVAEAESFDESLYDFVMRYRMVSGRGSGCGHQGEFFAADGACLVTDECACV